MWQTFVLLAKFFVNASACLEPPTEPWQEENAVALSVKPFDGGELVQIDLQATLWTPPGVGGCIQQVIDSL